MKVSALIEKLSKINPDARVKLHHEEGNNVLFALSMANDNSVVWLEDSTDIDLNKEIYEQLRYCENCGLSKFETFEYLLEEIGFTETEIYNRLPNERENFKKYLEQIDDKKN